MVFNCRCQQCKIFLLPSDVVFFFLRRRDNHIYDLTFCACSEECAHRWVKSVMRNHLRVRAEEFSKCLYRLGMGSYLCKMIWEMAYPPNKYYLIRKEEEIEKQVP
jgi:hypothetical protein